MRPFQSRLAAIACAATGAALLAFFVPLARSQATAQIQAAPSYTPIGVAAAGSSSMAWFHDTSSGRAVACQAVVAAGGALTGIQCAAARLP